MKQEKPHLLNLPFMNINTRYINGKREIWDDLRKKWLVCTPEEWVRQNFIRFLTEYLNADPLYIKQEHVVNLNGVSLRADIVVYDKNVKPLMLVECKAPTIKITEKTINQVCKYNMIMKVPYICVTNGINHFFYYYSEDQECMEAMKNIPVF
ncbi:MAG: type I restriction enzyme HsdR N-terminal domain-containing protein [Rikenellaceae bacterium]|nr:type I restriction enzyme HsdR N-terminal domain-containing protein [Rikenellaceae bacterium]